MYVDRHAVPLRAALGGGGGVGDGELSRVTNGLRLSTNVDMLHTLKIYEEY